MENKNLSYLKGFLFFLSTLILGLNKTLIFFLISKIFSKDVNWTSIYLTINYLWFGFWQTLLNLFIGSLFFITLFKDKVYKYLNETYNFIDNVIESFEENKKIKGKFNMKSDLTDEELKIMEKYDRYTIYFIKYWKLSKSKLISLSIKINKIKEYLFNTIIFLYLANFCYKLDNIIKILIDKVPYKDKIYNMFPNYNIQNFNKMETKLENMETKLENKDQKEVKDVSKLKLNNNYINKEIKKFDDIMSQMEQFNNFMEDIGKNMNIDSSKLKNLPEFDNPLTKKELEMLNDPSFNNFIKDFEKMIGKK